jgi:hypothetical protein
VMILHAGHIRDMAFSRFALPTILVAPASSSEPLAHPNGGCHRTSRHRKETGRLFGRLKLREK